MDIFEVVAQYMINVASYIDIHTKIFTVRIALMGLLFITLSYNFIYRRAFGGKQILYSTMFAFISFIGVYVLVPLNWMKTTESPDLYFFTGLASVPALIYVIPMTVSGIPAEQKLNRKVIATIVILMYVGQVLLRFKQ